MELRTVHRADVGVTVHAKHPSDLPGDLPFEFAQSRGELIQFDAAFRLENGLPGVEEQFGLEYETIADDSDVGPIAENGPQPAEKIGAVAREFLHPLRTIL